ncbi:MAG: RsmB/NOP family class I SAM-dependent RNA methyltransferase [Defluviitaleaceae bacterium]|nr:RsmB/NOP family class I SAM-dependent RNA methyltransferase [Defluviitaleaceae bacterium]
MESTHTSSTHNEMIETLANIAGMRELLGGEWDAFANAMGETSHAAIRANRLKITPEELSRLIGQELEGVPWCKDGFYLPDGFRAGKSPLYHAGLYYIQEPSAMSAAEALGVEPGEHVLDLCAAPGGKSTQLAGKLQGSGLLVCNDISRSRLKALVKNLELAGVTNSLVTCEEPHKLTNAFPDFFDKILIDAPCSGEGMFRKDKDVFKAYTPQKPSYFAQVAQNILQSAALMLAPGGRILFSTCTFNKLENENAIEQFLANNPNFSTVPIAMQGSDDFSTGFGNVSANVRRLFPHKVRGEGHFLALLQKDKPPHDKYKSPSYASSFKKPSRSQSEIFHDFAADTFNRKFDDNILFVMGDTLYTMPHGLPNLDGIRLVKTGLRLGEFKQARFEPSQALALALTQNDATRSISFSHTSSEVVRYLKGETLALSGNHPNGWTLVCTDGYPIGWGKVLGGTLKNKYNRNWLMN